MKTYQIDEHLYEKRLRKGATMNNNQFAQICKALSDPNRLQIIQMITDQERCACKLLEHFNISQPTLSHHMRILSDCGLIRTRKDGKWSHYSMNMDTMTTFKKQVEKLHEAAAAAAMAMTAEGELNAATLTTKEDCRCSF
jgi:ArsR family transcriptional regulator